MMFFGLFIIIFLYNKEKYVLYNIWIILYIIFFKCKIIYGIYSCKNV